MANNEKGYLALVLHAHLPFIRHPEYEDFLEEDWFFEAMCETYLPLPSPNQALLAKWGRLRELRAVVNKAIEDVRSTGSLGSSLQANLRLTLDAEDLALLRSLGEELKFVFIVSAVELQPGAQLAVQVRPASAPKCARCWHYRDDVGHDPAHPELCGRCTSNLYGSGEVRHVA